MLEVGVVVHVNLEAMHTLVVILRVDVLPAKAVYSHALPNFLAV